MFSRIRWSVVALAWCVCAGMALADPPAQIGKPAPGFTLADQNGQSVSLSSYRGKIVVLEWINPQCPFVQRHYKAGTMKTLASTYAPRDVVWLAINTTPTATAEENKAWIAKHGLAYPILSDKDGSVARQYAAKTTPHMFVISRDGTLVYEGAIDDDPQGTKGDRVNYVHKALEELLAGKAVTTPHTRSYGCSVKYAE